MDNYIATFGTIQDFHAADLKLNQRLHPALYATHIVISTPQRTTILIRRHSQL